MQSLLRPSRSRTLVRSLDRQFIRRQSTSRIHPLERQQHAFKRPASQQQWSSITAILLASLTGTFTYIVGKQSGNSAQDTTSAFRPPTQADFDAALKDLQAILPEDCISRDANQLEHHGTTDWCYHKPEVLPGAIIYPRTTEEVSKIVKIASKHSIPIVPFSGGTSLEGHFYAPDYEKDKIVTESHVTGHKALPGLAFCLDFSENMNQIVQLHQDDLDVVVQPGIGYEVLNATLKDKKLFFPVDPGPGAQIGGMIGTGCSGTNAVKYGTMRENVLNMTVVLPSGEIVKTRQRAKKCSAGPDLGRLMIGSEGTLGIVTEATLKLAPLLPHSVGVTSFDNIEDAASCVRDLVQQGVSLQCIELLDDVMISAVNQQSKANPNAIQWPVKPALFFKFQGRPQQIEQDVSTTTELVKKNSGSKLVFAKTERDKEDLWYARKVALWSALDYVPGSQCIVTDVCVPISKLPQLVKEVKEDVRKAQVTAPIVAHSGDGNIHVLLLYRNKEEEERAQSVAHRMVHIAQKLEGTCTGEHGIGIGKIQYLEGELGTGTINLLKIIKKAIDPQNIFNPGKLYPQ